MSHALVLTGWVVAIGAVVAAVVARHRMVSFAEAVARASHELRGPLAAARLGLELSFRGGQLADVRVRAIELELGSATLALDDLAEAWEAKATGSRRCADADVELVDVAQLLVDLVEAWHEPARVRGAEVVLARSGSRPVVRGERLRLAQAIGNLIANAVEHGGGEVVVSWWADATTVRIEVTDRGIGLPAPVAELAARPALRWPYLRRDGSVQPRHRRGSRRGHGLAIATAVATRHRGRLASAPSDRGARLVLELPRAAEDVRTARPRPAG